MRLFSGKIRSLRGLSAYAGLALLGGLALSFVRCSPTPVVLPAGTYNRPTDLAFTCLRLVKSEPGGGTRAVGRPMNECHPTGRGDPNPTDEHRTFAFLTNSERGDLSVIDAYYCRPGDGNCECPNGGSSCIPKGAANIDLDPAQPGFNGLPVGVLPERVSASQDGCRVVTANRGSCDFSVVNTGALLTEQVSRDSANSRQTARAPDEVAYPRSASVTRVVARTASGRRLSVAPGEISFLPQDTSGMTGDLDLCDKGGQEGTPAPALGEASAPSDKDHRPWRAVATFPSCNLVAVLELPSGRILDSVKLGTDDQGNPVVLSGQGGTEPKCDVVDCLADDNAANGEGTGDNSDAGPPPPPPPVIAPSGVGGVSALAIYPTGNRIFVGSRKTSALMEIAVDGASKLGAVTPIKLKNAGGVETVRLSLDPYALQSGPTPIYGQFVYRSYKQVASTDAERALLAQDSLRFTLGPMEFAYAIATDGSVRVVDLAHQQECDTQVDPRSIAPESRPKPCFAVDAADHRQLPGAIGPGLVFATAPRDVAFELATTTAGIGNRAPNALDGAFAFILLSSGQVAVANIDPTPRRLHALVGNTTPTLLEPIALTHSLRDNGIQTYASTMSADLGPSRVAVLPAAADGYPHLMTFGARDTSFNAMRVPSGENFDQVPAGSLETGVTFSANARPLHQFWQIAWEGDYLPTRYTAKVGASQGRLSLSDAGASFCQGGVYEGDIVTLNGCTSDAACGAGQYCLIDPDAPTSWGRLPLTGVCLSKLATQANRESCSWLTRTLKRFRVAKATTDHLDLEPLLDEKPVSALAPLPGCGATSADAGAANCPPSGPDGGVATSGDAGVASPGDAGVAPGSPLGKDSEGFAYYRDPATGRFRRLMACNRPDSRDNCRVGRICLANPLPGSFPGVNFCAEAPVLDDAKAKTCFAQLVSYKVSAGSSFLVVGSVTGAPTSRGVAGNGNCVVDPNQLTRNPEAFSRIWIGANETLCERAPSRVPTSDETLCQQGNGELCPLEEFTLGQLPYTKPCLFVAQARPPLLDDERRIVMREGKTVYDAPRFDAVAALFQNDQLRFILTDLDKTIDSNSLLQFEAQGGFSPQLIVPLGLDSEVDLPARILTSPIPSVPGIPDDILINGQSDRPMLFVVDQRRSNRTSLGAVRGQVVRIRPNYGDTLVPIYEGLSISGSYFPLQ